MELLVYAAKLPTIMNQHIADRSNLIINVRKALGVEEVDCILPQIIDLQKTSTRLEVIEKQQAFLALAMEVLSKQLEEKGKALVESQQAQKAAEDKANRSAWTLAEV